MEDKIYNAAFDGSTRTEDMRSTIGFVIHASNKHILCRSYRPVEFASSVEVEYKALIELLKTAIGLRIKRINIQGDCKVIIDQLNRGSDSNCIKLDSLNKDCRALLKHFDYYNIGWVPRKNNQIADRLSRRSLNPR